MPNERRSSSERYGWYHVVWDTPTVTYEPSQWVTITCTASPATVPPPSNNYYENYQRDFEMFEKYLKRYGKKERRTKLGNSLD